MQSVMAIVHFAAFAAARSSAESWHAIMDADIQPESVRERKAAARSS
jgi:hypothetical protein